MITQETKPDLTVSVQGTMVEAWIDGGLYRVKGTECSSMCIGPFEGGQHYLYYLHHSLASGQATGKEHSPNHQQKIVLKIC